MGPIRPIRRVAMISLHTSPLDQPGTGDAGGMNVYVVELAKRLARCDIEVDIFTRSTSSSLLPHVSIADGVSVRLEHDADGNVVATGNGLGATSRTEPHVSGLALGLTLGDFLRLRARGDQKFYQSKEGTAKGVIQIVLPGGMAHQESWDPKPDAPLEYRGPFAVAKSKLPGVVFSENFQQLAQVADKLTVVRSIAGKEADHGRATYAMYTGYRKSPAVEHPSLGAVVSHELGPRKDLPPYVAVPNATEYPLPPDEDTALRLMEDRFGLYFATVEEEPARAPGKGRS